MEALPPSADILAEGDVAPLPQAAEERRRPAIDSSPPSTPAGTGHDRPPCPSNGGRSGPASAPTCSCSGAARSSTSVTARCPTPSFPTSSDTGLAGPGRRCRPSPPRTCRSTSPRPATWPATTATPTGAGSEAPSPGPCRSPPPRRRWRHCWRAANGAPCATIGFLGGEPFLHRRLVHHVVGFAAHRAAELGQPVGFSVTTNATLLDAADLDLVRSPPVRGDGQPRRRTGRPTTAAASVWPARAAGTTPWPASARCWPNRGWPR